MTAPTTVSADPTQKLATEALEHEHRGPLGALAFDVLSRQAEGRLLFASRDWVEKRAKDHGVEREDAATGVGNLLGVLERGPETENERATLSAFALVGLRDRWENETDREALVERFTAHVDWLELGTEYRLWTLVDAVLDVEQAARIWAQVGESIRTEAAGSGRALPSTRARNAARLSALAHSPSEAAKEALVEVVDGAGLDEPTRELARTLAGDDIDFTVDENLVFVSGELGVPRRAAGWRFVRWVSGWALAVWLWRGVRTVVGARTEASVAVGRRGIELREKRFLLGRSVREESATYTFTSVCGAAREVRYPSLHLIVGVIALAAGVLLGGVLFFDGLRGGEWTLLVIGAMLAGASALVDLALEIWRPARTGLVTLGLDFEGGRRLRIQGVPLSAATRFLDELRARLRTH